MKVVKKKIEGLLELVPHVYQDERGFLARIYDEKWFKAQGFPTKWTEISHHHTAKKNIVRGIYVQRPPFSEGKLLRVTRGEMLWVSVDVRKNSETFGKWDSVVLSENEKNLFLTAPGFAHGCMSLTHNVDLIISSDNYFSVEHGIGIAWSDPDLAIDWKLGDAKPFASDRDKSYPSWKAFKEKYPNGI